MEIPEVREAWAVRRACVPPTCTCDTEAHAALLGLFDAAWRMSRLCVWPTADLIRIERTWDVHTCAAQPLTATVLRQGLTWDAEQWWAPEAARAVEGDDALACSACADGVLVVRLLASTPRAATLPSGAGLYLSLLWRQELVLALWWPVGTTLRAWVEGLAPSLQRRGVSPVLALAMGTWVLGGLSARAAGTVTPLPVESSEGVAWLCCDPATLVDPCEVRQ